MQGNRLFAKIGASFFVGTLALASSSAVGMGAWIPAFGINTQNPADMSTTPHYEVIAGAAFIDVNTKANNITINGVPGSGNAPADIGIPMFRLAYRLNRKWVIGFDYNQPGRVEVPYGFNPFVNVVANNTRLHTQNLNPRASYQINDNIAVGVGLDVERTWALLTTGGATTPLFTIANGEGWGVGWDGGVFVTIRKGTYLSLAGFSQVRTVGHGYSSLGPIRNNTTNVVIHQPTTFALRLTQFLSPKWLVQFMGTWSENAVDRNLIFNNTVLGRITIPEWNNNSFLTQLYTRYQINKIWGFAVAGSYEDGCYPQVTNNLNFPVGTAWTLFGGPDVMINKKTKLQLIYAHVWQTSPSMSLNYLTLAGLRVIGPTSRSVNVVDLRLTFKA